MHVAIAIYDMYVYIATCTVGRVGSSQSVIQQDGVSAARIYRI